MTFKSTSQRQETTQTIIAVIGAIILLVFVAGYIYYRFFVIEIVERNQDTLCPVTGSPLYTAIIFDKSDSYNTIQTADLNNYFDLFKGKLIEDSQISLYVINDDVLNNVEPEWIICVPQHVRDANKFNQTEKFIKDTWENKFEKPLDNAITAFMTPSEANSSPIFEIIQVASLTAFPPESKSMPKHIIIISDFLHHTKEWSNYRGNISMKELIATDYYKKVWTDLNDVKITMLYIRRESATTIQGTEHLNFWGEYFRSLNASLHNLRQIQG
jgi:hypothetical protein